MPLISITRLRVRAQGYLAGKAYNDARATASCT
jgi:hypothetical protein